MVVQQTTGIMQRVNRRRFATALSHCEDDAALYTHIREYLYASKGTEDLDRRAQFLIEQLYGLGRMDLVEHAVGMCNRITNPVRTRMQSKSGRLVASLTEVERNRRLDTITADQHGGVVAYNDDGLMQLHRSREDFVWRDAPVNEGLTSEVIRQLQEKVYPEFIERTRYLTLAHLDEFMRFCREQRSKNPYMTFRELHSMFRFDHQALTETYRGTGDMGGDCFEFADSFLDELRKYGVEGYVVFQQGFNALMQFPVHSDDDVQRTQNWFTALNDAEFSHGSVVVKYKQGEEMRYLYFEMGEGSAIPTQTYSSPEQLVQRSFIEPDRTIEGLCSEEMNRRALRTMTEVHMFKNPDARYLQPSERVTVDLFHGVVRVVVNAEKKEKLRRFVAHHGEDVQHADEEVTAMPHYTEVAGVHERPKIRGDDLLQITTNIRYLFNNPSEKVTVRKGGQEQLVDALDALIIFFNDIAEEYDLPEDFTQNMLYLMGNIDEYFKFLYPEAGEEYRKMMDNLDQKD